MGVRGKTAGGVSFIVNRAVAFWVIFWGYVWLRVVMLRPARGSHLPPTSPHITPHTSPHMHRFVRLHDTVGPLGCKGI
jgi:hypothetical protein